MSYREEIIGGARLILGDCRDVLPTLGGVGALVTDPPFGIGFKYASHDDTPEGYGQWIWSIIESAEARCDPGAPLFVWQASLNIRHFAEWFPRDWRLFCAARNFSQMRRTAMQYAYDPILVWWKPGASPWSAGTANRDWHIANTAPVMATPNNIQKGHPCPRPVDQVAHIVEQWCVPGGIVLDPFMGSGTTGVACARLGRKFIGIECHEPYFDIAVRRITEAQRQGDLLRDMPPAEDPADAADMFAGDAG